MDEQTIWEGKPNWKGYSGIIAVFGLIALLTSMSGKSGGVVVLIIAVGFIALVRMQYTFRITNQRIIARKGLIAKSTGELDIKDIRSINVKQSIMQRVLNIGSLEFTTASGPLKEVTLLHIENAEALKERIRSLKTVVS